MKHEEHKKPVGTALLRSMGQLASNQRTAFRLVAEKLGALRLKVLGNTEARREVEWLTRVCLEIADSDSTELCGILAEMRDRDTESVPEERKGYKSP